ncbi:MAG: DEAD/DEAH box helicase [Candidatus Dormibacteria bacterium]
MTANSSVGSDGLGRTTPLGGAEADREILDLYRPLLDRLEPQSPPSAQTSRLIDEALAVSARPGFETMISLPRLRFSPFAYQLRAAEDALRKMRGRAILADEVGLGKTIEAGLVLSELRQRGLAAKILVLTPTGLVEQWREELDRKFALPSQVLRHGAWVRPRGPGQIPIMIAPLALARRNPLRGTLVDAPWDLVIADEAHHLKNPQSASARLVRELRTRYLLLLTATPVENRLEDLFQLVSLVRPGHMGTPREFRRQHGAATGSESARNLVLLQRRSREVMVRHRRSEVALMLPRRLAETHRILPAAEERSLYDRVSDRVRERGRTATSSEALALRSIQRAAGSSPAALAASLEAPGWHDLAAEAAAISTTEKARALMEMLLHHLQLGEKVVVFTAFRHTLNFLAAVSGSLAIPSTIYHGSLSRNAKEDAIRSFAAELPVLLTTEAGGEGRNLQFCHVMINFDLPWNPMRIEQRLGRIHRIGQGHEVVLANLVNAGSIEDRILGVLERRINLFELVVGELDMILGRITDEFDFESSVFRAHVESAHMAEFDGRMELLGEQLARAREGYLESRARTDALVGEEAPG